MASVYVSAPQYQTCPRCGQRCVLAFKQCGRCGAQLYTPRRTVSRLGRTAALIGAGIVAVVGLALLGYALMAMPGNRLAGTWIKQDGAERCIVKLRRDGTCTITRIWPSLAAIERGEYAYAGEDYVGTHVQVATWKATNAPTAFPYVAGGVLAIGTEAHGTTEWEQQQWALDDRGQLLLGGLGMDGPGTFRRE